jgi:hypothetical protein
VTRSARTPWPATAISRTLPKGKAPFEISASVTADRMARDFGPISDKVA